MECTVTDLEDNALYYFAVTAYNEYGESEFSEEISHRIIVNSTEPLNSSAGLQTIDHRWATVNLDTDSSNQVIIVSPPTYHDNAPGVVRLDNVSENSFRIHFQEWDYLDSLHHSENVSFLALEPGRYLMDDGSIWEIGSFDLSGTGSWQTQAFGHEFPNKPYLFLTIQTYNDTQAVNIRARNISPTGFEAALFEQKSLMDGHSLENIGYLAIHSPNGSGVVELGGNTYPYLLQRTKMDHNWCMVLSNSLKVEEERSSTNETEHVDETVDVLALDRHLFAQVVSNQESDPMALRIKTAEYSALMEWGTVEGVTHEWTTIPLGKIYKDPVIIAKAAEQTNPQPGVIRIRNVADNSFEASFQEWNYHNGNHPAERMFYLVAESGASNPNVGGLEYEAGKLETDTLVIEGWEGITFTRSFTTAPALFTSVMTAQGKDAVTTRVHNLDLTGFKLAMQEMESQTDGHLTETLGWIAIEKGTGTTTDNRKIEAFSIEADHVPVTTGFSQIFERRFPVILQSLSSTHGDNTAVAAHENLTPNAVDILVREETSADPEGEHRIENISVFVAE